MKLAKEILICTYLVLYFKIVFVYIFNDLLLNMFHFEKHSKITIKNQENQGYKEFGLILHSKC